MTTKDRNTAVTGKRLLSSIKFPLITFFVTSLVIIVLISPPVTAGEGSRNQTRGKDSTMTALDQPVLITDPVPGTAAEPSGNLQQQFIFTRAVITLLETGALLVLAWDAGTFIFDKLMDLY